MIWEKILIFLYEVVFLGPVLLFKSIRSPSFRYSLWDYIAASSFWAGVLGVLALASGHN